MKRTAAAVLAAFASNATNLSVKEEVVAQPLKGLEKAYTAPWPKLASGAPASTT